MIKFLKLLRNTLFLSLFTAILSITDGAAAECTQSFSWLQNSESDLSGYRIYYGTNSGGPYPNKVDVGNPAPVDGRVYGDVSSLTCGVTYYFVLVAYNTGNVESDYTAQVIVTPIDPESSGSVVTNILGDASDADLPGSLEDTYINLDESNNVSSINLATYTWPENMVANAVIIKADFSQIPQGVQVQSAILQLYTTSFGGESSYSIGAHKIINHNPELTTVTGYTYDGSQSWTANSSAYNDIPLAQADIDLAESTLDVDTSIGYKSWDITGMVQEWLNGTSPNYGVLLNSDISAAAGSYRYFASSEASDASQRPKLIISYSTGEPTPIIMNIQVR